MGYASSPDQPAYGASRTGACARVPAGPQYYSIFRSSCIVRGSINAEVFPARRFLMFSCLCRVSKSASSDCFFFGRNCTVVSALVDARQGFAEFNPRGER